MMHTTEKPVPVGLSLVMAVLVAAAGTAAAAVVLWNLRQMQPVYLASLVTLWFFTVVTPAISAWRLHRVVNDLTAMDPERRDAAMAIVLALRSQLLMSGTMALLSAFTLIFRR